MNLLIPYVFKYDHSDPLFKEYTYGDVNERARKIKKDLKKGDYVFFHTSIGQKKYITAYYIVERVMDTTDAVADRNIIAKYKNPHLLEGKRSSTTDDVLILGDPILSRVLDKPLLFDRVLAEKLSLNIGFPEGRTETQAIGSATRAWRELNERDVEILLESIKSTEMNVRGADTVLSTDEVTEIIEKDIENFIEKNPELIGKSLIFKGRQIDTPVGRIDMLFEGVNSSTVVELKLNKIGREAVNQLRRYMNWLEKETGKDVNGIIVCKGVMPAFQEEFKTLKNIKICCYGWQLKVFEWNI